MSSSIKDLREDLKRSTRALERLLQRVDGNGHWLESGTDGNWPLLRGTRVLERDAPGAAGSERAAHDAESLDVATCHNDLSRIRDDPAGAAEVVGQPLAQGRDAGRVAVDQLGVGDGRDRRAQRARPRTAREGGDVGSAWPEVEPGRQGRRGCRRR